MDTHIRATLSEVVSELEHHRTVIAQQKISALLDQYPAPTASDVLESWGIDTSHDTRFGEPAGRCVQCGDPDVVLQVEWETETGDARPYTASIEACRKHARTVFEDLYIEQDDRWFTVTVPNPEAVAA